MDLALRLFLKRSTERIRRAPISSSNAALPLPKLEVRAAREAIDIREPLEEMGRLFFLQIFLELSAP